MAAIEGDQRQAPCEVDLFTDSQYVHKGITMDPQLEAQRLADGRQQAGQERGPLAGARRGGRAPRGDMALGQGHADDPLNNRVDALAVAAMQPFRKGGAPSAPARRTGAGDAPSRRKARGRSGG